MDAAPHAGQAIVARLVSGPPALMGVVNVTPDSFSDGGETFDSDTAVTRGLKHSAEGAEIIDVGGESTRPGAEPVTSPEEARRIVPVVTELTTAGITVSIDTRHAHVMEAALDAGAAVINDVSALEGDPQSMEIAAASDAAIVLMHMKGDPRDMNKAPAR